MKKKKNSLAPDPFCHYCQIIFVVWPELPLDQAQRGPCVGSSLGPSPVVLTPQIYAQSQGECQVDMNSTTSPHFLDHGLISQDNPKFAPRTCWAPFMVLYSKR